MKNILLRCTTVVVFSSLLANCSGPVIKSQPITEIREQPQVPVIDDHRVGLAENEILIGDLRALNDNAGKPSIGIIKGYYQLPEAFPFGAIKFERVRSFGFDYEAIKVKKRKGLSPYVVRPALAPEVEAISGTMNRLLDAGVKFKEISLADATKIMASEREALENNNFIFPSSRVPSGVDLLMSIELGEGNYGPVYVGRVIGTRDGQLYALSTQPAAGAHSLNPLIMQLVKDSLQRLGVSE